MFRSVVLATTLVLGAGMGAAFAQDAGPVMTGGGDNLQITYPQASRNVVGGAYATVEGGGDNEQVHTASVADTQHAGVTAVMFGGGDNMQILYAPSDSLLAARSPARQGG